MKLTEKQLEVAARKLCEIQGTDPDATMLGRHKPLWWYEAEEILELIQRQEAIEFALMWEDEEEAKPSTEVWATVPYGPVDWEVV